MERQPERSDSDRGSSRSETIVDARTSLALWLRAGRAERGMSLDDVARITKIQPRILERLEAGKLDGLPAEVFVRGFVRSFARCVGLNEVEALRRYASCGGLAAVSTDLTPAARALVDAMSDLVPGRATTARATPRKMLAVVPGAIDADAAIAAGLAAGSLKDLPTTPTAAVVEPLAVAEPEPPALTSAPVTTAPESPELPVSPVSIEPASLAERHPLALAPAIAASASASGAEPPSAIEASVAGAIAVELEQAVAPGQLPSTQVATRAANPPANQAPGQPGHGSKKKRGRRNKDRNRKKPSAAGPPGSAASSSDEPNSGRWAPTMPSMRAVLSAPWRKPVHAGPATAAPPCLVIDDADPDSAERILEERAEKQAPRRSFLPPILLDREDRSARQGGLTLAVIILLIAATLTLSYLMRRPSASGDGMTWLETPASNAG
jgi:cytoskeleton protein RodZ